ncbi:MAG: hypothetical protein ACXWTT_07785 [Methylobacter sp.]
MRFDTASFGFSRANGLVDFFESCADFFCPYRTLDLRVRKDGGGNNRFRKTSQAIDVGNENIADAPDLEFSGWQARI